MMKLLPHIDIAERWEIQAHLRDPRNYSWRAIDSEKLDTFQPDLGLTAYPIPSVFRPAGVVAAGVPSQLRHRFWQTVEGQADHKGRRYIGIVMHMAAGEEHALELKLGDMEIGRIKPQRTDNRTHLIVADKPVDFIGEMEVLQVTAAGAGSYRIEAFTLLHERPESTFFSPDVDELSHDLRRQADGKLTAVFHFTTSYKAKGKVSLMNADGEMVVEKRGGAGRLHRVAIPDLPPDTLYAALVDAEDMFTGESSGGSYAFQTRFPELAAGKEIVVPLELFSESDMAGLPLRFGLPFAKGAVAQIDDCALVAGDETLPASATVQHRWANDSVQWALIETQLPADLTEAALHVNGGRTVESPGAGVDLDSLGIADWRFTALLGDGAGLESGQPQVTDRGDNSAVFIVEHKDAAGVAQLRSKIWLRSYAGQRFATARHRLEVIAPDVAAAEDEADRMLSLREFSLRIPHQAVALRHGGREWQVDDGWQLRHDHDLAHEICGEMRDGRADGHLRIDGADGSLGIGLGAFWQTYPKALAVDSAGIDIELFPERRGHELPGDENAWHRLYFWLDDAGYKLRAGLALTSDILLDFGGDERAFAWLENPPLARPDIKYLNGTEALPPIGLREGSPLPDYDKLTDKALQSFHDDREQHRAYGQLNYGDWYGESGWSWGNNEYDSAYCGYVEFLRGGDAGWARWAGQAARHLADVDTLNSAADAGQVGGQAMHIPGHLGGYLPPFFRSKMRGTSLIPSHIWVEGPMLHWLLRGDEAAWESLQKSREWLLQARFFDAYDFTNAREAGWHLIHLCALAWLEDTQAAYAASILVKRVLERQARGGGWMRMLTDSHCGCGYPRCRGEAGFMVGVLLSGLIRYHRLMLQSGADEFDAEDVAEAIEGGARWLIRETFDEESGYFRYTSCKNRTTGGKFQCTQWVLEGLAGAYAVSGDEEIGGFLRRGLKEIGRFPVGIDHSGMGKAMAQQMRYVPSILAALPPLGPPPSGRGEAKLARKSQSVVGARR